MAGLLCLGACVPAEVPPQLAYTPGPAVIVAAPMLDTAQFSAWLPPGWKIVTSAASSPQSVILIAPDEDGLMLLSTEITDVPPLAVAGEVVTMQRTVTLANGVVVRVVLNAAAAQEAVYLPLLEQVSESLRPRQTN